MATLRVVPTFDEVEHSDLGFSLTLEASSIDQFALERGKEALGHGVVETVTDRSHRRPHTISRQRVPKAIEVY